MNTQKGSRRMTRLILKDCTGWRRMVKFTHRLLSPFSGRLGGPNSQCGPYGREKNVFPYWVFELEIFQAVA